MHNKQQQKQQTYCKKLAAVIKVFSEVVLFGPTGAKSELFNFLRKSHLFANVKVQVINADKMIYNQQH
ncbi:MAG: hypothetical protein H7199_02105 [Burkholderiales bacterium]|nr:hypothetical protein [Flavobacterium sp.]